MKQDDFIADREEKILVTGANGFIGTRVVQSLVHRGFGNMRCLVRSPRNISALKKIREESQNPGFEIFEGNLLSPADCEYAAKGVSAVYHLAASTSDRSFSAAYDNSVTATRNLLDGALRQTTLKRFTNVSSFSVYSTTSMVPGEVLDETCEVEKAPEIRGEAYCYGKVKQEEMVLEYHRMSGVPYVILRPGVVYGPGKAAFTGRIGILRSGVLLHLGGKNKIPFTYVDNCAEAIVLAGLKVGVDGEVLNIVDDELPSSRQFVSLYKKNVRNITSIYLPKAGSFLLCYLWEKCSAWSGGRLPPIFNTRRWSSDWKGMSYTNEKLKRLTGWEPGISTEQGLKAYFEYCRDAGES